MFGFQLGLKALGIQIQVEVLQGRLLLEPGFPRDPAHRAQHCAEER